MPIVETLLSSIRLRRNGGILGYKIDRIVEELKEIRVEFHSEMLVLEEVGRERNRLDAQQMKEQSALNVSIMRLVTQMEEVLARLR